MTAETREDLLGQVRELQERLNEAEETLRALRSGEVDAVVTSGPGGDHVYTLRGADEAYRIMVQNMAEGALTLAPDGLILFSNEQFASMLGIPLERVIGSFVHDFVAAEDASMLSVLLARSSRANAEIRLKKAPAVSVFVHISATTLVVDGVECICLVVTDLSEQRRSQEIIAAERLARSILDQAAGAILVVNPHGRIIRASRAAEEMAEGTVLLQNFDEVFRLRDSAGGKDYKLEEILSTVRRSGTVAGLKSRAGMRNGRTLDVIVSASLLAGENSEYLGSIVLLYDVSSLRRTEERLRKSEEQLRLTIDSAADIAIFTLDREGCVASWSPGAEFVKGYNKDEIIGQHVSIFYSEEDRRNGAADLLLQEAVEKGVAHEESWHVRKGGAEFWADITLNVLHNADGSLRGFSRFVRDLSDRRNAATERARLICELEEKNRQLQRSNQDLEQFAYAVSHDLQEPLRSINIHAELLEQVCAAGEPPPADILEGITGGAARMKRLIQDILAFSRVSGSDRSSFGEVDMNAAVKWARENLAAAIADSSAELVCEPLGLVTGDFSQVALVFQNLIGNAMKYRGENRPRIVISARREGNFHRVSVQDNGMGIDPKFHARIFGLFKRLHSPSEISGTGVGLAIVQRIVERHGGRIWVESELGRGATFFFTLAATEADQAVCN